MDTPKVELIGDYIFMGDEASVDCRTIDAIGITHDATNPQITIRRKTSGIPESFSISKSSAMDVIKCFRQWASAQSVTMADMQRLRNLAAKTESVKIDPFDWGNIGPALKANLHKAALDECAAAALAKELAEPPAADLANIPHPTGFSPDDFKSMISDPKTQFAQWTSEMTGTPGTSSGKVDYSRFTDRARKVMALANQESQRFNHEYVAPEHILLGIAVEGRGSAAIALKNLGADLRKVRLEVEKLMKRSPDSVVMGKLPRTPRAAKVIEYAAEENDRWIGTEHLIIGLLRENESIAFKVLASIGVTLDGVRGELAKIFSVAPATPEDPRRKGREFL